MRALLFMLSFMLASATVSYAASREAEQGDAPQAKSGDKVTVEAAEDGIVKGSEITPTQAEGPGRCRLSVKPMSIEGVSIFHITGEGFIPGKAFKVTTTTSSGERRDLPIKAKGDGTLNFDLFPGPVGGEASITASDSACSVTVKYSWRDYQMQGTPGAVSPAEHSAPTAPTVPQLRSTPTGLPEAPKGFHWEQATKIKAVLLVPDGWFFRTVEKPSVITYFISREDSRAGWFQVGLTLNVKRVTEGDVVAFAKEVIATITKSQKVKEVLWTKDIDLNLISGAGCGVELAEGHAPLILDQIVLGNPKTKALYILSFEAPKAEWEEASRLGREIMNHVALSKDF